MIYLDNNATTEIDPRVLEAMLPYLSKEYGNPSSAYSSGRRVAQAIGKAREQVAALIGCEPDEVLFTSCGTESNNTAVISGLDADLDRQQLVTTKVEHSALTKQGDRLARKGYAVSRIGVDGGGALDFEQLEDELGDDTAIVSVMWANNETGVIFPIEQVGELARASGALFHTDAVQMAGKLPLNVRDLPVDYLSIAGHKLHAPKGVGALYVAKGVPFSNILLGGGQESGRRGGTENVASIVALGAAAEVALSHIDTEQKEVKALRDAFEKMILENVDGVQVNGSGARLPNTTNLQFENIDGEGMLILLDERGICASSGSACTTGSLSPSHVLTAMGLNAAQARGSLRFSFGRFNRMEEALRSAEVVIECVKKLRAENGNGSPVAMHATAR